MYHCEKCRNTCRSICLNTASVLSLTELPPDPRIGGIEELFNMVPPKDRLYPLGININCPNAASSSFV